MDPAQSAEGLEVHRGVAHRQVAALHQGIAELTRQIQVFEIALVEAPRCQQDHQRRLFLAGCQACQGLLQSTKEARQMLHPQVPVQLR
ncbi:hypothetical protein D3C77_615520 [compost metagenome]